MLQDEHYSSLQIVFYSTPHKKKETSGGLVVNEVFGSIMVSLNNSEIP